MSLTSKKGSRRRKKSVRQLRISEGKDKRTRATDGMAPHAPGGFWNTKVVFGDDEPNSGEEAQEIYISSKTKERE